MCGYLVLKRWAGEHRQGLAGWKAHPEGQPRCRQPLAAGRLAVL